MRILLADDHDLYREGVQLLLQQLGNVDICEACNRDEIQKKLKQEQPDILLLDLDMPGVGCTSSVHEICLLYPTVAVIIMSGNNSPQTIQSCLEAGVAGFIPKSSSTDVMLAAIRVVYAGGKYIPPQAYEHQPSYALSSRQKEIFQLLNEGKANKQIAASLNITESTVKQHITELFRKLGVSNRVEAILQTKNILNP